jgi:hypothetical protein
MYINQSQRLSLILLMTISFICTTRASAQLAIKIVNVIPQNQSAEINHNTEPSIAVDPLDIRQVVVSSFGAAFGADAQTRPYFSSRDMGSTWTNFQNIEQNDTTLDWSPTGKPAYAVRSIGYVDPDKLVSVRAIPVMSSTNPAGLPFNENPPPTVPFTEIPNSGYTNTSDTKTPDRPDQPWIMVTNGKDPKDQMLKDRIYVGFGDGSRVVEDKIVPRAAMVFSIDGGKSWNNDPAKPPIAIPLDPTDKADGNPIRVAASGDRVYAAYDRLSSPREPGKNMVGNVIVVRDDAGLTGANKFQGLNNGMGQQVLTADTTFPDLTATMLGNNERLGSDLSIAANPDDNTKKLYVAFAEVVGDQTKKPVVRVAFSDDRGDSWKLSDFKPPDSATQSALPALAVAQDGRVGLLYYGKNESTRRLEVHLALSREDFAGFDPTKDDTLLASFRDENPDINDTVKLSNMIAGDYVDLQAVGNDFYGAFAASNNLQKNEAMFLGGPPIFQRFTNGKVGELDFKLLDKQAGAEVPFSIDPYYFSTAVPEPPPWHLVILGGIFAACGLHWRGKRARTAGPILE